MPVKNYQDELLKELKDPQEAAEYLNACFQDSEEVFLQGLRNVIKARGGIARVANLTELNRENLYRSLSRKGNPKFSNLTTILEAVGITLLFKPQSKRARAA
jgi:probable addiction module antidote protein